MNRRKAKTTTPTPLAAHQGPLAPWFEALAKVWQDCHGTRTVMEERLPLAVIDFDGKAVAVLVAMRPDGQQGYGLFDDGHGNVQVGVYNLSEFGYPRALDVYAYKGADNVWGLYWKARDGLPYLLADGAATPADKPAKT
jgi:hypothetical protein